MNMKNTNRQYILENKIRTDIGYFYPITVGDYDTFEEVIGVVGLDKIALINYFKRLVQEDIRFQPLLDMVQELSMLNFIKLCGLPEYEGSFLSDLNEQYTQLFKLCTKCNHDMIFYVIETDDEFQEYLNLIREMNGIVYEPTSPNPEVERRNQLARKLESMKNEGISFESMFTSICVGLKKTPSEVNDISLYSFYKLFGRIGQFKNYDSSVLFATVATDVKIEPWYKTDEVVKNESYITEEQLNKARELGKLQDDL